MRKAESTGTEQERMLRFLKDATVQLDSRLEGNTFTVEDLLALEDGDLLTFDHPLGRSLDCLVNGMQKFKGQVVRMGNKKAFRIA